MLSRLADVLVPAFGRFTVTADAGAVLAPGSIIAANHTSLADPAVVLAALHRLGARPVVMAAAGLWRVPVLGGALAREDTSPSTAATGARRTPWTKPWRRSAADGSSSSTPRAASRAARTRRKRLPRPSAAACHGSPGKAGPRWFRSARPAARRVTSGSVPKQLAGLFTAPLRPAGPARAHRSTARSVGGGHRPDRAGPHRGDGRLADGRHTARRARRARRLRRGPTPGARPLFLHGPGDTAGVRGRQPGRTTVRWAEKSPHFPSGSLGRILSE